MMMERNIFILPVAAGDGEGDHAKHGGGVSRLYDPSTVLRTVPLPIRFAEREELEASAFSLDD